MFQVSGTLSLFHRPVREVWHILPQDVFWLPELFDAQHRSFPSLNSGPIPFLINFPGYSSAPAMDSHHLPFPAGAYKS